MRDDAVSPIVAFMLLLMVIVSFISILNAYYIPSLKQQAEVQHLHLVEESFSKITPDMLQILTFRKNLSMKESFPLGGGDVIFSPLKSSGYLEVNTTLQSEPLSNISVQINGNPIQNLTSVINQTKIVFRPVGNFWIRQGYVWNDGVLNVTKGNRITFLQYPDTDTGRANNERDSYYEMLFPRIKIETNQNNTSSIQIDLVNIENPGSYRFVSGNGVGNINIQIKESNKTSLRLDNQTTIRFQFFNYNTHIFNCNSSFDKAKSEINYMNNTELNVDDSSKGEYSLKIKSNYIADNYTNYPTVTITRWNLSDYVI